LPDAKPIGEVNREAGFVVPLMELTFALGGSGAGHCKAEPIAG